jgi:glyoxylase-like metal-dependent hydrolase (beta-lactamase superfamily II)
MSTNPQPKLLPPLNIPFGTSTCTVSIINTTCSLVFPTFISVGPPIPGHKWMNVPVYAFHITHQATGTQLLFDLGCRKDWWNLVPQTVELLTGQWPGIKIDRDITEIMLEGGVKFGGGKGEVSKVIISHHHFDHIGDLSALPREVEVVVGPGFREAQMPGYPSKAESSFHEADFVERKVFEVPFDADTKTGKMESYDLFGDGSVQILNAPGHAVGHICALVRTTEDSYLLLGGDTCHFVGKLDRFTAIRPWSN